MKVILVVFALIAAGYTVAYLYFTIKERCFKKIFGAQLWVSVFAIALIKLTAFATGVDYPLNSASAAFGLLGGLPAVAGILIINYIFIL